MTRNLFIGLVIMAVWVSSCTMPLVTGGGASSQNSVKAWFDAPLPRTVLIPPSPCQIVAHGASPNGIALFELSINGAVAASISSPDTQSSLVTLTQDCGLSGPGNYLLQMRVQDNAGEWSGFAETSLIILGNETPTTTPTLPATGPTASETPTPTATLTLTPTTASTGSVSVEQLSNDLVYIGRANCGPLDVSITVRASAPKGVKVVVLFYRFEPGSPPGAFDSIAMNPIGGDLYQASLNPTSLMGGSVPFEQATLQYQVVVQQSDGDTSLRTPVLADIVVQACGSVTASCSSYTDQRTCIANGCKWVQIPATVPLYACQNP